MLPMRIPIRKLTSSRPYKTAGNIARAIQDDLVPAGLKRVWTEKRAFLVAACTLIFALAIGVRLLHWQDSHTEVIKNDTMLQGLGDLYRDQADRILHRSPAIDGRADATMVIHPPGYALLIAAADRVFGRADSTLRVTQIVFGSLMCVMILLIVAELLPLGVAVIAGFLSALSPHHAYYSLYLSPDLLSAVPLLVSVYLIVRARAEPRIWVIILAGICVGLSCWLRANSLLVAPVLALAIAITFKPKTRLRYGLAFMLATVCVIAPITIRNWIVFGQFIPLSAGAGITLIEGIADYDHENRFGLPLYDADVPKKDAEWFGRPEYAKNPWSPDGIERDRLRFARGLSVIRSNPGWFLNVMLDRGFFMLRYNDFARQNRYTNTTIAPTVAATPGYKHGLEITNQSQSVWSLGPSEMIERISASKSARASIKDGSLRVENDTGGSQDLFSVPRIGVERNTDYLLSVKLLSQSDRATVKVGTNDPRIVLATTVTGLPEPEPRRASDHDFNDEPKVIETKIPFASGNVSEISLIFANAATASEQPTLLISGIELYSFESTPNLWTKYVRVPLGAIQKNIFKTRHLLTLNLIGILLLIWARKWPALVILLAVPVYFLVFQSAFHTEYRYILTIHYFLFVMGATTVFLTGTLLINGARRIRQKARL